jgi:hypothetical protein
MESKVNDYIKVGFVLVLWVLSCYEARAGDFWLETGGVSHHFHPANYNEGNWGPGITYRQDDIGVSVGAYRNSNRETSHYVYGSYQPAQIGGVRIGIIGGVIDGYPRERQYRLAAVPMASYEYKAVGVDALLTTQAVALKFRVKF